MLTRVAFVLLATAAIAHADPPELLRAKAGFERLKRPAEGDRVSYIVRLIGLRQRYAKLSDQQWRWDVDAEILSHPAPPDTATYTRRIVGKWRSPRHDYLYRADGTLTMLPVEPDSHWEDWRIDGNKLFQAFSDQPDRFREYTIILLTTHWLVFTDGYVYYHTRN